MMKETKSSVQLGHCMPLNKATLLHTANDDSVKAGKAVTVLTYLHGVKEAQVAIDILQKEFPGIGVDLIELRSLKPLDMETIRYKILLP